jgi:hypothetical protein
LELKEGVTMSTAAIHAAAFIKELINNKSVWTVRDEVGFPAPKNPSGERAQPFWSSLSRVQLIIKNVPAYSKFTPYEINLDDFMTKWLPGLNKDGIKVGVNWSGQRATGYDLSPEDVIKRVSHELSSEND